MNNKIFSIITRPFKNAFFKAHSFLENDLPEDLNPLANIGAVANITFIIAIATGVLLLFWYAPSVFVAYESVADMMTNKAWYAGIVRSVHRYSSDACVLAMLFHIAEILVHKKFDRPRWPAWITGVLLFLIIWFEGWIGYWLVWDEGARYIATSTAKLMDVLPVFAEPMSRSFLTKDSINSLFFFVVFFGHMLVPLGVAFLLWIHITRLSKPKLFTKKPLTIYVVVTLVLLSIIKPAPYGPAADLQSLESIFPLDYFFAIPLYVIDYCSPVVTWAIFLFATILITAVPFLNRKKTQTATFVDEEKCHACRACYNDCPFNSIQMIEVGKSDKGRPIIKANIDKDICVQCGICAGSCSTDAIIFPLLPKLDVEKKIRRWINESEGKNDVHITFICKDSLSPNCVIDETTGACNDLPGHKVISVPCTGWINMTTLEEIAKSSIGHIHIVSCGSTTSYSRFGSQWAKNRISGDRYPKLELEANLKKKITQYEFHGFQWKETVKALTGGTLTKRNARPLRAGVVAAIVACILIALPSDILFTTENAGQGKITISFKHPALFKEVNDADSNTDDKKLRHMKRKKAAKRSRENIVLQVFMNGEKIIDKVYPPSGMFGDGIGLGTEEINVATGKYDIEIVLKESESGAGEVFSIKREIELTKKRNMVVLFDKGGGFKWY